MPGDVFDFLEDDNKDPNVPRWAEEAVEGTFSDLSGDLKKKLKGQLLIAAAPCYQLPSPDCMLDAFERIAQALFDAEILRPNMLQKISLLVWEASRQGGWQHVPDDTRREFGKQRGWDDVWSDQDALFRTQLTYWDGRLLDGTGIRGPTKEPASKAAPEVRDVASRKRRDWPWCGDGILSLRKSDGTVEAIPAQFSARVILVLDVGNPIAQGDMLIRTLPSGLRVGCVVDDPGYHDALGGIPARYEVQAHRAAPIDSLESSGFWRERRADFEELSRRQREALRIDREHPKWLRGYCSHLGEQNEYCDVDGGLDSELRSRFEDLATQAAIALGCSADADPVKFWVSCLCLDLLQNSLNGAPDELLRPVPAGGFIVDLLKSSAAYCSRLASLADRKESERQAQSPAKTDNTDVVRRDQSGDANIDEVETEADASDPEQEQRASIRSAWLNRKLEQHRNWTSDTDIEGNGGPAYNTIQRYRSGVRSTRDRYVRRQLARAFSCDITEVPV